MRNRIKRVNPNKHIITMIGFGLKSGQIVRGYDAVVQSASRDMLSLIMLESNISANTMQKLTNALRRIKIPVVKTSPGIDWKILWGIETSRIMGILKGDLGRNIMKNFNAGV
jgi:ribosomal protein L7Ae-like RNA K-turn-binding protein